MSDDDWERYGIHPARSTDDLLDRHLGLTGARQAANEDAAAQVQVAILRDFLRVLHAALDDEHVDPVVSRRIIERVIYGGVPQPSEVSQRIATHKAFADYVAADTRPTRINVDGETLRS